MSCILCIDFGNSTAKVGLYVDDTLQSKQVFTYDQIDTFKAWVAQTATQLCWYVSVTDKGQSFIDQLKHTHFVNRLDYTTVLPFENRYKTPQTLGMDRIAAIAGAQGVFNNRNCLVFDFGTCITSDVLIDGNYLGGSISPGLNMRLQAMHHFTNKLPQLQFEHIDDIIGNNTINSMLSGAYWGVVGEINERISRYEAEFGEMIVLACGGDAHLFVKHLKKNIFAAPDLVLNGLYQIHLHHATKGT